MIKKLQSRKLWLTILEVMAILILAFGFTDSVLIQVIAIIMSALDVGVYTYCQAKVDRIQKWSE